MERGTINRLDSATEFTLADFLRAVDALKAAEVFLDRRYTYYMTPYEFVHSAMQGWLEFLPDMSMRSTAQHPYISAGIRCVTQRPMPRAIMDKDVFTWR